MATVRAPTDGFVAQVFLHPGMMTVPFPISPVMVFVHSDAPVFAAAFPQNTLQWVRAGDAVELAFEAIPGRVFPGRVQRLISAMAEGQLQPAGKLFDFPTLEGRGRVIAVLEVDADLSAYHLPAGASAEVAVYTEHGEGCDRRQGVLVPTLPSKCRFHAPDGQERPGRDAVVLLQGREEGCFLAARIKPYVPVVPRPKAVT